MKNKKYYIPFTLLALFVINSILVIDNKYVGIDESIHNFIIRFSSEMTTKFMKIFTFLGSTPFIILLCILIFVILLYKKQKEYAYKCAGILIISTLINNIVKVIVRRPRPEYITVVENTFSYPSGHTMASVTLYGFLIYFILKSKISKKDMFCNIFYFVSNSDIKICYSVLAYPHSFCMIVSPYLVSYSFIRTI